jgi:hippurate hydrolase
MKDKWKGTLLFIAQPAEERSGGAKAMLAEGLYQKFGVPAYGLALHVSSSLPAGTVGLCSGYSMANVDMVDITVFGRGGHGAAPHTTIDPVVLAARLILDLQTIVSREVSPNEAAVVTVGSKHGGAKGNVIPEEVKLELTLRSYKDEVRQTMITGIERRCQAIGISAGLPTNRYPLVTLRDESTPALYNDPALTKRILALYQKLLGSDKVAEVPQVMTGEDFGRFGRTEQKVPVLLYWLGAVEPDRIEAAKKGETPYPSLHSATFAPLPEPTIKTGILTMAAAALELLKK